MTPDEEEMMRALDADADLLKRQSACIKELLGVARRWVALDAGGWHPDRCSADKSQLTVDTLAAIARAEGVSP